ncbi:hypothetical protein ACT7V1_001926 [Salmonella enterica subsp. enterica]
MRGGGKGGGKSDWDDMMRNNPGAQKKALDAVLDAAKKTDKTHGASIFDAVIENITKGNYEVIP